MKMIPRYYGPCNSLQTDMSAGCGMRSTGGRCTEAWSSMWFPSTLKKQASVSLAPAKNVGGELNPGRRKQWSGNPRPLEIGYGTRPLPKSNSGNLPSCHNPPPNPPIPLPLIAITFQNRAAWSLQQLELSRMNRRHEQEPPTS